MFFYIFLGLLIVFFIIDILTMFYMSTFIKKFIKSIPLFIKDLIGMDRKVFHGYGFWCFCGLGGSGKTLSMVEYLLRIKEKYPKVKILTNFSFDLADSRIESWKDLLETTNFSIEEITEKEYNRFKKYKTYSEKKRRNMARSNRRWRINLHG